MKQTQRDGRRFGIPVSRRLTWDLLYFHQDVPLCGHDRIMQLGPVAEARRQCGVRVSWPALFIKAFAIVARDIPELRQTWYRWPWAHLYQHPCSVAALTVQRYIDGVPWLFWGKINRPEDLSLEKIQQTITLCGKDEAPQVFAGQYQLAHLPLLLRRLIWWVNLNVATRKRAKRLGTFFLSTLGSHGAEIQIPPSVHTGCLTFGPLDEANCSRVTLAYDHRVMDGVLVADVLRQLEVTLNTVLVQELKAVSQSTAESRVAA
jgi:hypothetical protein